LEAQATEIVRLKNAVEEYERRENFCDRRWCALVKENEMNDAQIEQLKEASVKQKESY
jgi:hypothetical protein